MAKNDNDFRTSDTALAAFLTSEGHPATLEFSNGFRATFVFNHTDPKLDKLISDFDTARAKGNIVLFFNAYQTLLRRIRERY